MAMSMAMANQTRALPGLACHWMGLVRQMAGHVLFLAGHGHGHVLFKFRACFSFLCMRRREFLRGQLIKRGPTFKVGPFVKSWPLHYEAIINRRHLKLNFLITRVIR